MTLKAKQYVCGIGGILVIPIGFYCVYVTSVLFSDISPYDRPITLTALFVIGIFGQVFVGIPRCPQCHLRVLIHGGRQAHILPQKKCYRCGLDLTDEQAFDTIEPWPTNADEFAILEKEKSKNANFKVLLVLFYLLACVGVVFL